MAKIPGQRPPYLEAPFRPAPQPAEADPPSAQLLDLHRQVAEAIREDASSNDVVQLVDDFFVEHGLPTVLYGEVPS
ncbi:hypothetical protein [Dactylosporangium sp. CA-139066]|uniref:hypothetical protein n=1 Tax=Dactylosporangium sp. CA-139066 TaxID=3239930 RepID=UPI003D94C786